LKHAASSGHKERGDKPFQVWVLRHAIAISRDDPECPEDPLRALTAKGRRRQERAAEGLCRLGVLPERIITSPYVRARETAEIVAAALGFPLADIEESSTLEPGEDPRGILAALRADPARGTLLCGHSPHVDRLIARIVGAPLPITALKKGGVACLELPGGPASTGILRWLLSSRALGRLAGA